MGVHSHIRQTPVLRTRHYSHSINMPVWSKIVISDLKIKPLFWIFHFVIQFLNKSIFTNRNFDNFIQSLTFILVSRHLLRICVWEERGSKLPNLSCCELKSYTFSKWWVNEHLNRRIKNKFIVIIDVVWAVIFIIINIAVNCKNWSWSWRMRKWTWLPQFLLSVEHGSIIDFMF